MKIPRLKSVKQLSNEHDALNEGGIRWDIFNEDVNGLKESGAIIRHGRKVLIDEELYFSWLTGIDYSNDEKVDSAGLDLILSDKTDLRDRISSALRISPREAQKKIESAKIVFKLATDGEHTDAPSGLGDAP